MKNSTKKAVILNNLTSPYVYQAILILKNNDNLTEHQLLDEAEKIVSEYFEKNKKNGKEDITIYSRSKKSDKKPNALTIVLLSAAVLLLIGACILLI